MPTTSHVSLRISAVLTCAQVESRICRNSTEATHYLQILHVYLRYAALKSLQFAELNQKRASLLVQAHISQQPIPGKQNSCSLSLASTLGCKPVYQLQK